MLYADNPSTMKISMMLMYFYLLLLMVGYYFWIIRIHYDEWRSSIINIWITNRTSEAMKDNLKIVMVLYLFIHPYLWLDNQGDCCYLQQRFPNRYWCLFYWDCVICSMSYRLLLQLSGGLPFLTYKKVLTRVLLLLFNCLRWNYLSLYSSSFVC